MAEPTHQSPNPPIHQPDPNDGVWPYLGVGCITFVSGFFGGGMIAVLIAKIVGAAQRCTPDAETGAPCNWYTYAVFGAGAGMVLFPAIAVTLMRRGRLKQRNKA
jgi:hypothetical protein